MSCDNHYPILTKWKEIDRSGQWVTFQCPDCGDKHISKEKLGPVEFIPEAIKEGRKQYRKELLQPWRQGEISKEYLDAYPEQAKGMIKEGIITKDQAKKAKNVWGNDNV